MFPSSGQDNGPSTKSRNAVNLNVIHYHRNSLDSTPFSCLPIIHFQAKLCNIALINCRNTISNVTLNRFFFNSSISNQNYSDSIS
jgi:hypothetical protein